MTATTALTIPSPTTAGGHGLGVGGGVTVLPPDVIPIKQDGLGQGEILTARVTRRGTESDVRIRILDFLGEGSTCTVYLGKDLGSEHHYAVKVFKRGPRYEGGYQREQYALSHFSDDEPRIVKQYGYCVHRGHHCLIQEPLKALRVILAESGNKGMSPWSTKRFAVDVLKGLEHVHQQGLVHADLKLSNIMWSPQEACFVIIDFGLSFGRQEENLHVVQTWGFISPETVAWNENKRNKTASISSPPSAVNLALLRDSLAVERGTGGASGLPSSTRRKHGSASSQGSTSSGSNKRKAPTSAEEAQKESRCYSSEFSRSILESATYTAAERMHSGGGYSLMSSSGARYGGGGGLSSGSSASYSSSRGSPQSNASSQGGGPMADPTESFPAVKRGRDSTIPSHTKSRTMASSSTTSAANRDWQNKLARAQRKAPLGPPIDVWSFGCMLFQVATGVKFIPQPRDFVFATPDALSEFLESRMELIDDHIYCLEERYKENLQNMIRCCLSFYPSERISISALLAHPFLQPSPSSKPYYRDLLTIPTRFLRIANLLRYEELEPGPQQDVILSELRQTLEQFGPLEFMSPFPVSSSLSLSSSSSSPPPLLGAGPECLLPSEDSLSSSFPHLGSLFVAFEESQDAATALEHCRLSASSLARGRNPVTTFCHPDLLPVELRELLPE